MNRTASRGSLEALIICLIAILVGLLVFLKTSDWTFACLVAVIVLLSEGALRVCLWWIAYRPSGNGLIHGRGYIVAPIDISSEPNSSEALGVVISPDVNVIPSSRRYRGMKSDIAIASRVQVWGRLVRYDLVQARQLVVEGMKLYAVQPESLRVVAATDPPGAASLVNTSSSANPTADEIYNLIQEARARIPKKPGVLARLFNPAAKREAAAIESATLEATQSMTALLVGIQHVVDVYVRTHMDEIKIRQKAYLIPRITGLIDQLNREIDQGFLPALQRYSELVQEIGKLSLREQDQQQLLAVAYRRVEAVQTIFEPKWREMITELTNKMVELIES